MERRANSVARAATIIMIISVLGKLLGFVREQVIASQYGASGLADAYVTAWTVPQVMFGLVGGAIGMAFVPVLLQHRRENPDQARWLLSAVFRLAAMILIGASALAFVSAPAITRLLVPSFTPAQQSLTATMLRIMLPGVVLAGLASFFTYLLNAHQKFAWPALAPLMLNLGVIGGALLLKDSLGVVGLGWATLMGTSLQFLMLWWQVRRANLTLGGGWSVKHDGVRQVMQLAWPIMLSLLFSQLYQFVDKGFASALDPGSISALNYALKLTQLPVGIFVTALATAIYPTLSEFAGKGDKQGLSAATGSGMRLLTLVMVPAAVGMIVLRTPIVSLSFERGSFDAQATAMTASALAFYAIGLLGVANMQILNRSFYSLQDSLTPVKVSIACALTNVLLAALLVTPLGHSGLALANSLAMLLNMTCLIWLLSKKTGQTPDFLPSLAKITGAAAAMGLVVHFLYPRVAGFGQIIALGLSVGVGVLVYLGLVAVLGVEELSQLIATVKRRLGRGRREASEVAAD